MTNPDQQINILALCDIVGFEGTLFSISKNKNLKKEHKLTIQRMDPDGCSQPPASPLHLVFTVANPKSPIFTVRSSCRKMSSQTLRILWWL